MWNDQQKSDYLIAFLKNLSYIAVIVILIKTVLFSSVYHYIIIFYCLFIYFCFLLFVACIYIKCNLCYGGQLENKIVH